MKDFFFVKEKPGFKKVSFGEILFVEGKKNYCKIHTTAAAYLTHTTMKELEASLPAGDFIRIHKSYIVSVNRIREMKKNEVCLQDVDCFPVGDTFRDKLSSFIEEHSI